ncbi:MAG TPA: hypothetical protein VGH38_25925 [Bryobacteraceae bacterium]|jgi:hypothetical protein
MKRSLLFLCAVTTLALAGTKSYMVNLMEPALLGSTELKPGEYRVEVVDQKAVLRRGKSHNEAPVKVETADSKYTSTTVRFTNGDGKLHIQEIHIGGSKTKLVFTE